MDRFQTAPCRTTASRFQAPLPLLHWKAVFSVQGNSDRKKRLMWVQFQGVKNSFRFSTNALLPQEGAEGVWWNISIVVSDCCSLDWRAALFWEWCTEASRLSAPVINDLRSNNKIAAVFRFVYVTVSLTSLNHACFVFAGSRVRRFCSHDSQLFWMFNVGFWVHCSLLQSLLVKVGAGRVSIPININYILRVLVYFSYVSGFCLAWVF